MSRRERALDGPDEELTGFAAGLRELRQRAGGVPYRRLSVVAHFSAATLSEAAAGRKLPSLQVTLAYVRACGGDADEWANRWRELSARLASGPDGRCASEDDRAPYLGLGTFQIEDADRFFGRDRVVDEVRRKVGEHRFLGVFGASGSGKSSLLRAGLLARTLRAGKPAVVFTPGARPMEECAVQLSAVVRDSTAAVLAELTADPAALSLRIRRFMVGEPAGTNLLVVVDQFEELFTTCTDATERGRFIEALVHAANDPASRARIVIGVRADFLGHCGRYPVLVAALADAQVLVGAPAAEDLHRAIVEPAVAAGCVVEKVLAARLLADVTGREAALPLLSHALLQTWRRRQGTTLTLAGYEAVGGVAHSIAHTAEEVYLSLEPDQRTAARHLFLRMITPGEHADDTKRKAGREELGPPGSDLAAVLEKLTSARLVTQSGDHVELSHEALIRHWPRLREWLDADRAGLRLHRQLTDSARAWDASGHDASLLFRGTRLRAVQDWADRHHAPLTTTERAFIAESWSAHQDERAATDRHHRRLRLVAAAVAVLLVLSATVVVYAVRQREAADRQHAAALAQTLITQAAALRDINPDLATQLSLAAYRLSATPATRSNLLSTFGTPLSTTVPGLHIAVAVAADRPVLATADADGSAWLWDITTASQPTRIAQLPDGTHAPLAVSADGTTVAAASGSDGLVLWSVGQHHTWTLPRLKSQQVAVSFSPDGSTLASIDGRHRVELWDIHTGQSIPLPHSASALAFGPGGQLVTGSGRTVTGWSITPRPREQWTVTAGHPVTVLSLSPDAHTLAAASDSARTVELWDVHDTADPVRRPPLPDLNGINDLAFAPDNRTLVTATDDTTTRVWDLSDRRRPATVLTLPGHAGRTTSAAFAAGGTVLVSADSDGTVRLHELTRPGLAGHNGAVRAAAVLGDQEVATAGDDGTARVWWVSDLGSIAAANETTGDVAGISALAYSPANGILATGGRGHTIRFWRPDDRRGTPVARLDTDVASLAFRPDGRVLASGSSITKLWDVSNPASPRLITTMAGHSNTVTSLMFSPDGRLLATASSDHTVRLWDVSDPRNARVVAILTGHTDAVTSAAFSPDGRWLATGGNDQIIRLWRLTAQGRPALAATLTGHTGAVTALAFDNAGTMLASGSADHAIRLWPIHSDGVDSSDVTVLSGPTGTIRSLVFGLTHDRLVSVGDDTATPRLWETDPERVAATICSRAPAITRAEWNQYLPNGPFDPPCA